MGNELPAFRKPSIVEAFFNKSFGFFVGLGLGFSYNYLLQVPGRKSGRVYSTPIDLLEMDGRKYLVAPRGRAQWVRNAEAAGKVVLKRGRVRQTFLIRPLADADKPRILKSYLDRFHREVQRYFPVEAGSGEEAFVAIAPRYPAFELKAA